MAIDVAGATRPVNQAIRVGGARAPQATARRAQGQREADAAAEARAQAEAAPVERRVRLPEITPHDIAFRHDAELNRIIVEVVDPETGAVVRSIPPEEIVRMFKIIRRAQGRLLDEEA
jgi:flagellar protein FlaG